MIVEIPTLETERLRLRAFRQDDFDVYAEMQGDPDVVRYLTGTPMSRTDAWRHMSMVAGHWVLRGFGMWALEEKSSGELVGRAGPWMPDGWPDFEIGWTLRKKFWGRGYATEAATAAMTYAFEELGRTKIVSIIHPDNVASQAVARRIGEAPERDWELNGIRVTIWSRTR